MSPFRVAISSRLSFCVGAGLRDSTGIEPLLRRLTGFLQIVGSQLSERLPRTGALRRTPDDDAPFKPE
jgi:hypothetical protein